jgi:hypothetical protein
MRKALLMAFFLLLAALCSPREGEAQQKKDKLAQLMDDKLLFAKRLLEGIALGDFTKVTDNAENLIQVSKTAEWFVHKTPRYELHSNEFRRACEALVQKAKAKNIDGVALAYVELTMSCFRCHQYVRELRDVGLPPASLDSLDISRPEESSGE